MIWIIQKAAEILAFHQRKDTGQTELNTSIIQLHLAKAEFVQLYTWL